MHADLMFPNKYLKAADLRGKDVTLTISALTRETLTRQGGKKDPAWLIDFEEMKGREGDECKRFVLNKTNRDSIKNLHGTETDNWIGKKITLFPTTTRGVEGNTVECLRIRAPRHRQSKPA